MFTIIRKRRDNMVKINHENILKIVFESLTLGNLKWFKTR